MVRDIITTTQKNNLEKISASREAIEAARKLRRFLNDRVYYLPGLLRGF